MTGLMPTLVVMPVILPLVVAALMLLLGEQRRQAQARVGIAATLAGLLVAAALLWRVDAGGASGDIGVYLAANWQAPFGITLVADRLSALMVLLVALVGLGAALYAEAGWSRAGAYFHPLFQIQLMGLNGAFLTGDLFNLFVFFEVMLAASYGLQLHGSGPLRVRSGLHYIAVNLLASALFLIGLAVIYGVLGTLSMADMADKVPQVDLKDRGLLHAGAAMLGVAFLVKAAIWPLNAWLVPAYTAASVPVAALFVLMTKVGIYAVLRIWTLMFFWEAGASAHIGAPLLLAGGVATLAFGAAGLLGSIRVDRIAAFSLLVSSGTVMAAIGIGSASVLGAALFYLASATLAASGLFLMVELVKRTSAQGRGRSPETPHVVDEDDILDDDQVPLVGRPVPVSVAALGLAFMVFALLVAGLPPLSGFLGKLALLLAMLQPDVIEGTAAVEAIPGTEWLLIGLLLASGLCATVSLARAGIRHFWAKGGRIAPPVHAVEAVAVSTLLVACLALTVFAEPAARYTRQTADYLHAPRPYVDAVLGARARPGPTAGSTGTVGSP
nr:monovalent cation/H+ antiporter subunit D [uncultured Pseudoxanthomonas sp.]